MYLIFREVTGLFGFLAVEELTPDTDRMSLTGTVVFLLMVTVVMLLICPQYVLLQTGNDDDDSRPTQGKLIGTSIYIKMI